MSSFDKLRKICLELSRKASHINTINPEILVGQIWLKDDEPPPVEITELNSSDEFGHLLDEKHNDDNVEHAWSYINNNILQDMEDTYKINKKAREKRRMNIDNHLNSTNTSSITNNDFLSNLYSDIPANYIDDSKLPNHQVNCFTIINNHLMNSSDTTSDGEYADVEIITSSDIMKESNNWDIGNNYHDKDIITQGSDLDRETRTIWIYSFKNKHLLTEDNYEFTNGATKETSSFSNSCSLDSDEEIIKDKSTNERKGSPIPATYIPRLNLASTLSTVTEVSEPNKQPSPNVSNMSPKHQFQKPRNSWIASDTEKLDSAKKTVHKYESICNVVNWMALSPRDKKRKYKEQCDKRDASLTKTPKPEEKLQNIETEIRQDNSIRLQVDVDVHVSVNDKSPGKRSISTVNATDVIVTARLADVAEGPIYKAKVADADHIEYVQDHGDHAEIIYKNSQLTQTQSVDTTLDELQPNVNNAACERESNEEKESASFNYETNKMEPVMSADHMWMKNNMPLLKPSNWTEYLPIASSSFSLHLSLGSIIEERQSWFKRFMKYINCCK